jgi:hydroxymethylbilane synthase
MATLRMGTRGSELARAQSGLVARALEKLNPGLTVETNVIRTTGDRFGAPTPEVAKTLPQGAKGLWVKEIEEALLAGSIDFAVHSAKDLPAALVGGLTIAAFPKREDARDALVARKGLTWDGLGPKTRVATSSLRRSLMLSELRHGVQVAPLRGNVDTRLEKLAAGEFDAMIVALAGLKRLGRTNVAHEPLDPGSMIPAPAQGALALEIRADRADVAGVVAPLDHGMTRACVELERAFLAAVGGGCGAPVAAHATPAPGGLRVDAFFAREGEAAGRRVSGLCDDPTRRAEFARELAAQAAAR